MKRRLTIAVAGILAAVGISLAGTGVANAYLPPLGCHYSYVFVDQYGHRYLVCYG